MDDRSWVRRLGHCCDFAMVCAGRMVVAAMIHLMIGFLLLGACIFMARALYRAFPRTVTVAGKLALSLAIVGAGTIAAFALGTSH